MIKSLNSGFQANLTLTFSIAGNGVVVVHGFGEAFIEDTSIWAAVPCIPPLPVLAGVFGLATCRTLLPGIAVADRFRIHWVREHSLVHGTCRVSSWFKMFVWDF